MGYNEVKPLPDWVTDGVKSLIDEFHAIITYIASDTIDILILSNGEKAPKVFPCTL
jgi:hypothetical protein